VRVELSGFRVVRVLRDDLERLDMQNGKPGSKIPGE
jgi:hypothetical protein